MQPQLSCAFPVVNVHPRIWSQCMWLHEWIIRETMCICNTAKMAIPLFVFSVNLTTQHRLRWRYIVHSYVCCDHVISPLQCWSMESFIRWPRFWLRLVWTPTLLSPSPRPLTHHHTPKHWHRSVHECASVFPQCAIIKYNITTSFFLILRYHIPFKLAECVCLNWHSPNY